jgi:hypothetical protein
MQVDKSKAASQRRRDNIPQRIKMALSLDIQIVRLGM